MLICEYPAADPAELRRNGALCRTNASRGVELYLRDDAGGSVIICDNGAPPAAPLVKIVEVLFTGGEFGERGGDWMFLVGLWTPAEFRDEFLAWYKLEHLPILLECPTWNGCRFVEQQVAEGCQFYALHQLSERAALDSEARKRSRSTPWFKRLAGQTWFDGAFTRVLCKRLTP